MDLYFVGVILKNLSSKPTTAMQALIDPLKELQSLASV